MLYTRSINFAITAVIAIAPLHAMPLEGEWVGLHGRLLFSPQSMVRIPGPGGAVAGGGGGPAVRGSCANYPSSSATTVSCTLSSSTQSGDTVVVGMFSDGGSTTTASDDHSSTYQTCTVAANCAATVHSTWKVFWTQNSAAGISVVTETASFGTVGIVAVAFSGLTTTPYDIGNKGDSGFSGSPGSGIALPAAAITTTNAHDIQAAFCSMNAGPGSGQTWHPGASWTTIVNASGTFSGYAEWITRTTTSTYSIAGTFDNSTSYQVGCVNIGLKYP